LEPCLRGLCASNEELPVKNLSLSLASALLLMLIFPPFNFTWFAPVALAPLLIACARETSWKRRWAIGWAAGFAFWCGVCPWIQFVLEEHGGMGRWGSWGGFALFGLYKGLHTAVFATLAGYLLRRWWAIPATAALWTGIEHTHGFFGFGWLDLGNAGIDMPLPMRLAPVTGVHGLSFVFAMLAGGLAAVILHKRRRELTWLLPLVILLALPRAPRPQPAQQKALIVQPNIDTELTWTAEVMRDIQLKLSLLSRASGAQLILWPEVPAPFYVDDAAFRDYAAGIARASETSFLLGAVGRAPAREPLNSAALFDASGKLVDRYDKINLVPFGEFIPPLFGWVNRITQEAGDFVPGSRRVIFPLAGDTMGGHRMAAFICYESAFPDLVREFTHLGAEVLVNISNDGYFGHSAAHQQHLSIVRMRAAENRRWILRATNDGISAAIDPRGRVVQTLVPFEQTASLVPFNYATEKTAYTRYGDWFAWGCFAVGFALAGYGAWLQFRNAGSPAHRRP
jgi:apolipoprotein N-acyltransferase